MPGLLSDACKLYPGRFTHLGSRQFQQHLCERAGHPGEPGWLAHRLVQLTGHENIS